MIINNVWLLSVINNFTRLGVNIIMARKGENIFKRKDGRWEARYIKGYESSGKAVYGYVFGSSYLEAKRKRLTASGGQHISSRMCQQTTSQQMDRQIGSFSHAGISSRMMKSKLSALKKGKKYGAHIGSHINVYNRPIRKL